jgi:hypothetical protein
MLFSLYKIRSGQFQSVDTVLKEDILAGMTSPLPQLDTVLVIKPEFAVKHCGKVLRRLHNENFTVIGMYLRVLTSEQAMVVIPEEHRKVYS